jgi:hypothetical protein
MIHPVDTYRRVLVGALALLLTGATTASARTPMKLSDTITFRAGSCWIVSDTTDSGTAIEKAEPRGARRCKFTADPIWNGRISVPGDKDESIDFNITIAPDGTITGQGREGEGPGAYECTITGKTRPGAGLNNYRTVGAVLRVWELPSLP